MPSTLLSLWPPAVAKLLNVFSSQRTAALSSPILFSPAHIGTLSLSIAVCHGAHPRPALVPLLLVLARIVYVQAKHHLGSRNGKDKHMSIFVKWGRERYVAATPSQAVYSSSDVPPTLPLNHSPPCGQRVPFSPTSSAHAAPPRHCRLHFPVPPPDAKLGQLRHEIAEYTQLPAQSFKLIHAGAVMKDDNAPGTCIHTLV